MVFELDVSRSKVEHGAVTFAVRTRGRLRLGARLEGRRLSFSAFGADGALEKAGELQLGMIKVPDVGAADGVGQPMPFRESPVGAAVSVVACMAAVWCGADAIGDVGEAETAPA